MDKKEQIIATTCNQHCGGSCVLKVHAKNGMITRIETDDSGQKAAFHIDRYLQGHTAGTRFGKTIKPFNPKVEIPLDVEKKERQCMPRLPASKRHLNFKEVALGFNSGMAMAEAKRCLNCAGHLCKDACPYNVPQFADEERPKMQKCDFCLGRWAENKKPICVDACPTRAMVAGPLDEIKSEYGDVVEAGGFDYSTELKPSIVFKPRLPKET
jgi:Fe-S-cluster-containing hydrogenase component 2